MVAQILFANNYPHFDVINWPVGTSCGCVLQKYKKTETPHEPQRQQNKLLNITTFLVIRRGFEPRTHSLEGCCSIQLSYQTKPFRGAKVRINEQKNKY